MADPFRSARLIYRAAEPTTDEPLFLAIQQDAIGYGNSNARKGVPQSKKNAQDYLKSTAEDSLLGVVICLPPTTPDGTPTPIGTLHLDRPSTHMAVHRHTDLGIDILQEYQGKGYGGEAIMWATGWAFKTGGMHRVQLRCFEWNDGARRLYERLGFKPEGRWRELLWHEGRFWDDLQFSMLDREWWAMQEKKQPETK